MKREKIGFGFLLMGVIFAAPGDSLFWWIGFIIGVIGLSLIISSKNNER